MLEAVKTSLPLVTPAVFFPPPPPSLLPSVHPTLHQILCKNTPTTMKYYNRNMFYQYFSIYIWLHHNLSGLFFNRRWSYASICSKPKRRSMRNLSFSPKVSYFVTQLLMSLLCIQLSANYASICMETIWKCALLSPFVQYTPCISFLSKKHFANTPACS